MVFGCRDVTGRMTQPIIVDKTGRKCDAVTTGKHYGLKKCAILGGLASFSCGNAIVDVKIAHSLFYEVRNLGTPVCKLAGRAARAVQECTLLQRKYNVSERQRLCLALKRREAPEPLGYYGTVIGVEDAAAHQHELWSPGEHVADARLVDARVNGELRVVKIALCHPRQVEGTHPRLQPITPTRL